MCRGFLGGRGSGKSWAISYDLICRAQPGRLYMMVSPTYTILADTDFRMFGNLAYECGVIRSKKVHPPNIMFVNGAEILFRSGDDPEKLRGPNLSGVSLNEASLMNQEVYKICMASLRQGGQLGFLTAGFTPKGVNHWTYEVFGKHHPDTEIFHSHTRENPFNPPAFTDKLLAQYTEDEARQELAGEFIDADEFLQAIPTAWVRLAMQRWQPEGRGDRRLSAVGVDVARGGEACTVLAPRYGFWWDRLIRKPGGLTPDGPAVVELVAAVVIPCPLALVVVDVIGVGSSVFDLCRLRRWNVLGANFASHSNLTDRTGTMTFLNLRAWAYWSMRELLDPASGHEVQLPPDEQLLADLTAPRWKPMAGGVQLEKKDEIEKRIGRSPDSGDAVVMSILQPVDPTAGRVTASRQLGR